MEQRNQHPAGRRHFAMFDTFRFFAFLKVFLQHLPIVAFAWFNFARAGGIIGVQFFFVLSGFLITYIIFDEKSRTGTFSLKNFFARRVLRIWPLFYLVVILCYATPWLLHLLHAAKMEHGYQPVWWMSALFLENYKMIAEHTVPNEQALAVTWSLCVEEHFYLLWGLLLWFLPARVFPWVAGIAIAAALVARTIFFHYHMELADISTNIHFFAIGAIPAYLLVFHTDKTKRVVSSVGKMGHTLYAVFLLVYVLLISQADIQAQIQIWLTCISAALFAGLIFLSMHDENYLRPSRLLTRLGVYTYGLYMYHSFVLVFFIRVFTSRHWQLDSPVYATLFAITALIGTVVISWLSYKFFEKPFLKMKRLFR